MKRVVVILIILFVVGAFQAFVVIQQNNSSPIVSIISPSAQHGFKWHDQLAYSINVEDKEDGISKYEEIAQSEVFLKIKFASDSTKMLVYQKDDLQEDLVLRLFKKNGCFNCHGIHSKIAAPSYESIALKYQKTPDAFKKLGLKIIQGSKGVWGDSQMMPSHPELSTDESIEMVKWIMKYGPDADFELKVGLKGLLQFQRGSKGQEKGKYILIATYLDHGLNGKDIKEGKDVLVLSPVLE